MIQAPPTGMLVKCILNLAPSLSISTSYLLQLCSTETTIQGYNIIALYLYNEKFSPEDNPFLPPALMGETFYPMTFLPHVSDYIEPMVIFTALVKQNIPVM